jgi:hypothetical protein
MAYRAKKPRFDSDVEAVIKSAYTQAVSYIDTEVAPHRERATNFYFGRPLGNEDPDRSQFVLPEVRNTSHRVLQSLQRVFFSTDKLVEVTPRTPEDDEPARQATDYLNYVLLEDNDGQAILQTGFLDGLVRKTGIIKWSWQVDESADPPETFSGLTYDQVLGVRLNTDYEILSEKMTIDGKVVEPSMADALAQQPEALVQQALGLPAVSMTAEPPTAPMLTQPTAVFSEPEWEIVARRIRKREYAKIEAVPVEEFLISRRARTIDTADYVAHRRLLAASDLIAMGYDREVVLQHAGEGPQQLGLNEEALARDPMDLDNLRHEDGVDESRYLVLYVEHYVRLDLNDDGVSELYRVCTVGGAEEVVHYEETHEAPFAILCPCPEPHAVIGSSLADEVMDLQLLKSTIARNMIDNHALTVHPQREVVDNAVVDDDDLEVSGPGVNIRVTQAGAIRNLETTFTGQASLAMLGWADEEKAARTGISRTTIGLDADMLQSTTRQAVQMQQAASEGKTEQIARNFAMGIRALAKGVLGLIIRNQDKPRTIRLRNRWVSIDPTQWVEGMDCKVSVGLGRGDTMEQIAALGQVLGLQREVITQLGPDNVMTDLGRVKNTIDKMMEKMGYLDTSFAWKEVDPAMLAQMAQAPQEDPNIEFVKVQAEKVRVDAQVAMMRQQLEAERAKLQDDRERDKIDADIMLRAYEMQLKYGAQVDIASIRALVDRDRNAQVAQAQVAREAVRGAMQPPPQPSMPGGMM